MVNAQRPRQHLYNVCLLLCVVLLFANFLFMKWSLEFQTALYAHGEVSSTDARTRSMAVFQELYRIDTKRIDPLWRRAERDENEKAIIEERLREIDEMIRQLQKRLRMDAT